jgi:hypothetical protein
MIRPATSILWLGTIALVERSTLVSVSFHERFRIDVQGRKTPPSSGSTSALTSPRVHARLRTAGLRLQSTAEQQRRRQQPHLLISLKLLHPSPNDQAGTVHTSSSTPGLLLKAVPQHLPLHSLTPQEVIYPATLPVSQRMNSPQLKSKRLRCPPKGVWRLPTTAMSMLWSLSSVRTRSGL